MKKICSKCIKELSLDLFHKEKNGKFGRRAECKDCVKKRNENYDKKEKYDKWKERHLILGDEVYWNARARKSNERAFTLYNITEKLSGRDLLDKFIQANNKCFYCGDNINHNSCHIEHRTSLFKKGLHTIDNIEFSCKSCNLIKGEMTEEEFYNVINKIYNYINNK